MESWRPKDVWKCTRFDMADDDTRLDLALRLTKLEATLEVALERRDTFRHSEPRQLAGSLKIGVEAIL